MIRKMLYAIHRYFDPVGHARFLGVLVGSNCRLIDVRFGSEPWLIRLGSHVSITDSQFITHDGGCWVFREMLPAIDRVAPIVIGDNVFIGSSCIILPGVVIGSNVVIGAGSVVTRNVPDDCVAAGVPARPIRSIEEYKSRLIPQCDDTKGMSRGQKRRYYLQKYSTLRRRH